jgi:hypothetical protein
MVAQIRMRVLILPTRRYTIATLPSERRQWTLDEPQL